MKIHSTLLAGAALVAISYVSASAQQVTGVPGSPSATTTIEGNQLPPPPQKFEGKIERNAAQSTPYWPMRVVPPKGAPNVLLIMTDDTGFGVSSTFGGVIPSPTLDRIAASGLRYTNFNSTALCSPTRAAMITGRNHHSVGFGVVAEQSTGFPGYNSVMTRDKATIGRILKDNGYCTRGSARITTHRSSRRARPDPSISGQPGWASTISMASSAAMPTSGSRIFPQHNGNLSRTLTSQAGT